MSTNTLTDRSSGQVILETFFNDIHSALNGDMVGRNSSGVATSGQNLGTNAIKWGTGYFTNIVLGGSSIDTSLLTAPKNRIVSGKTRSTSGQAQFIKPNGAVNSFLIEGATTNLVLDINGASVSVSTDITKSSLTVGPSTTATCLVNMATAADQESTRTWGEVGSEFETITVDTMGAEFQTFIGQFVIIEISGTATEYAYAYVKSVTELTNIYRGWFTDSSNAPVNRVKFSDNDTITVLSTGHAFVENDGATVDVTYTNPIKSFTAPSGSVTGDYWYDLPNETWKRYDGASWQIINRTYVGIVGIDSANCVCARSFDFYFKPSEENNINLEISTTEIIKSKNQNSKISVSGVNLDFSFNLLSWNISTDLAAASDMYNATEQNSTLYFLYIANNGELLISDISPIKRLDLMGHYHPHNPWRCVGKAFNDSSGNFSSDRNYFLDHKYNPNKKIPKIFGAVIEQGVINSQDEIGCIESISFSNSSTATSITFKDGFWDEFKGLPPSVRAQTDVKTAAGLGGRQASIYDLDASSFKVVSENSTPSITNQYPIHLSFSVQEQ